MESVTRTLTVPHRGRARFQRQPQKDVCSPKIGSYCAGLCCVSTLPGPGEPSSVRSLCTAVVWGPPAQPNGVIVGYDIQFRRIGTSQISTTAKEIDELFHVAEGISIPPGTEDLEFRVSEAKCSHE